MIPDFQPWPKIAYTAPESHDPSCDLATCPEQHPDSMNHLVGWKAMGR